MTPAYINGFSLVIAEIVTIKFTFQLNSESEVEHVMTVAMQPGLMEGLSVAIQETMKQHIVNQAVSKSKMS